MRKLTIGLAVVAVAFAGLPAVAGATGTTTGEDSVGTVAESEVPTQCIEYLPGYTGPSRVIHSAAPAGEVLIDLPDCSDVEGICVEVVFPSGGPSRAPHAVTIPEEPCVPAGPACDITVELDPPGPARAAHQASGVAPRNVRPSVVVDIPQACQDVLSAAPIPTTGSDSSNILWLGAVLVGLGAVLVTTRRVATVRSR